MGERIEFSRPDGSLCPGYLAQAGAGRPGVIVIQEWWGLNAQICGIADRFAEAGCNALAPDLFHGRVTQDPDEASHLMNGLDFAGATHQDIRGATDYLGKVSGKVGVMGFCMGGALTIAAAVHVPGLAAAVCFYGIPPPEFADPASIRIPFQGHFASRDDWCTPAIVAALEAAMKGAGQTPELYRYDAAHAFFNERRPEVYDADKAQLAWQRTLDFLRRKLV
ncbi:MAG: carboxymethylenebutenolidase [Betaproteobacteria bacterium HGW-Betaproteobacteria-11]|nr:MAG: carboxymethylenebutenolidase [Betaproteobacteria bacterium HGW-Betaproteobacteria-11]